MFNDSSCELILCSHKVSIFFWLLQILYFMQLRFIIEIVIGFQSCNSKPFTELFAHWGRVTLLLTTPPPPPPKKPPSDACQL